MKPIEDPFRYDLDFTVEASIPELLLSDLPHSILYFLRVGSKAQRLPSPLHNPSAAEQEKMTQPPSYLVNPHHLINSSNNSNAGGNEEPPRLGTQ